MENLFENTTHNQPELSITQISTLLKRTVEDAFGYVRIRGEVSSLKVVHSGHVYFSLKDEKNTLAAVMWKGTATKIKFKPEDGMEVICTGKITTFGSQSKYQIVVETIEIAGEGALMALLEKRKQQFIKEGLFDATHKKPIPYLPLTIGVVTSPTGAVIRDILHRLRDRFPVHVLLWPVKVQGTTAKDEIAHAIKGFNTLPENGTIPRPELIIVARGGGSIEDLWAFNEECVVRATAASHIPVISAVGHETDTTLIDFVSDKRAPTPTAAAEMAVPVRSELILTVIDYEKRLISRLTQLMQEKQNFLEALSRGITSPMHLINTHTQHLDNWTERLQHSLPNFIDQKQKDFSHLSSRLTPHLILRDIDRKSEHLKGLARALPTPAQQIARLEQQLQHLGNRLDQHYTQKIAQKEHALNVCDTRLSPALVTNKIATLQSQLDLQAKLLESYHYKKVLDRGYALIWDDDNNIITSAQTLNEKQQFTIEHADGKTQAATKQAIAKNSNPPPPTNSKPAKQSKKQAAKKSATPPVDPLQTTLF